MDFCGNSSAWRAMLMCAGASILKQRNVIVLVVSVDHVIEYL